MNIMLIDDDEAIRMMLQDIIEDYELGTVSQSLPSAVDLSAAQLSAIDILIIDLLMPGIDGIEAVHRLKDGFAGKIIMLS
ncbi:MAG: response regulator, partial [Selenomonas sp.]|nr:response regulator [Selenomonas sp.]